VVLERTLYRRLYGASHLDQVLFSIGLVFMSISIAHFFFGAQQQPLQLPPMLSSASSTCPASMSASIACS
jgi:branched-chain amino acid transport system permease protein